MIEDADKKVTRINKELKTLDDIKDRLNEKIRGLRDTRKAKVEETKKIVNWALGTQDENVKELREQWLMAAKLIYDSDEDIDEVPDIGHTTRVLNQDEIDSLLGFDDDDGDDQDDLAAEWEAMMNAEFDS